jgi:hypothetical protein
MRHVRRLARLPARTVGRLPVGCNADFTDLAAMASPSKRTAHDRVAAYHAAQLVELVGHVEEAIVRLRGGELDAFETDHVIFQYSRAAKELWKFCNASDAEFTASLIAEGVTIDWWVRGEARR